MAFTTLIQVSELNNIIDRDDVCIVDCRFDLSRPEAGYAAYLNSRIADARYAHLDNDLSGQITPTSGRHPLPDPQSFVENLARWGIDNGTQVIAYDANNGAIAARLWWLLRWIGHRAVAVLDGGFEQWQHHRRTATSQAHRKEAARHPLQLDDNAWVSSTWIENNFPSATRALIDVRANVRYRGEQEPIDTIAGHIPGAINIPFTENLDCNGRFLAPELLRAKYAAAFHPLKINTPIIMCGSGVTACHTLLALEHAALPGAKLYSGSWSEWIRDPARPIVTGTS